MRFSLLPLLSLPLALAQTPFPQAFALGDTDQQSSVSSLFFSYGSSLGGEADYTSLANYMATAVVPGPIATLYAEADLNPVELAQEFFTATATPTWYGSIPTDMQSYISSVASAEASIVDKVVGAAPGGGAKVAVVGAVLGSVLVGMILL